MVGAPVILLCNIALNCFIDPNKKACVSPNSEVHQRELSRHGGLRSLCFPATAIPAL